MENASRRKTGFIVGAVILAGNLGAGGMYLAMSPHNGMTHHSGMAGHHGAGTLHDEANMPGLRGENATVEESAELALLFRSFDTITREVENLPKGIRTVTRSSDRAVMDALVNHSVGMIDRVGQMDDPQILIQSPTLDIFFLHGNEILSDISVENEGLVVVQTSDNPEIIEALQKHAAEVTAMTERGMQAVHEMMAADGRSH